MYLVARLFTYIKQEFTAVSKPFGSGVTVSSTLILFTLIIVANFAGLLPYVFPGSGHLPYAISLAIPLWVGHYILRWVKQPEIILTHLVPSGSPPALMPLIVVIELVSGLIRPLTLSIRLVANIIAGHLLLTLLRSGIGPTTVWPLFIVALLCLIVLRCLETAVALIQAYVFRVLSTLYLAEVESVNLNAQ